MTFRHPALPLSSAVILRKSRALARDCLEGWPQARSPLPCFETAARLRERPPQHDGCVCCVGDNEGRAVTLVSLPASPSTVRRGGPPDLARIATPPGPNARRASSPTRAPRR